MGDNTPLSPHFTLGEFVRDTVDRKNCALPFAECVDNLQALCVMVLEPWRVVAGPLAVNSGLRDLAKNAALATDPSSAARVANRPGPHTTGESADLRVLSAENVRDPVTKKNAPRPEPDRSNAYLQAFHQLYGLVQNGLPVHEAILEYAPGTLANPTSTRITHIHVQYQCRKPIARRFVARRWKVVNGKLAEDYLPWRP